MNANTYSCDRCTACISCDSGYKLYRVTFLKQNVQNRFVHIGKQATHCVCVDGNLLPGISWGSCPAADYLHMKMLGVQARYPKGHLA